MLLSLCLLAASFAADLKPAGTAEISGTVDVPLYGSLFMGDTSYYVEVTIGDKSGLLRLATTHDELRLTSDGQKLLGVELKGEKEPKAKVEEIKLGAVVLKDVVAVGWRAYTPDADPFKVRPWPLAGEIGLAGFHELAFAVLPSEGVLRLAPADQGASLVSALGASLPYTGIAAFKKRIGSGDPTKFDDLPFVVEAGFSGQKLPAILALEAEYSGITREVSEPVRYWVKGYEQLQLTLPPVPSSKAGEFVWESREISLGTASVTDLVSRPGLGPLALFGPNAYVGQDLLRTLDLAVDPVNHMLGYRAITAHKLQDYRPVREAELKVKLEPAPVEEGKEPPTEEEKKKARLGAVKALAEWYDYYDSSLALPYRKEIAEAEPELCTSWYRLGRSQFASGQPAEALTASRKAAELYDAWAALSLAERTKTKKAYDAAKKKEKEWTGSVPQDHACHRAWGDVAAELLAMRDYTGAAALYPAKMDLDENLAVNAGIALFKLGKVEEAQAAFLQAIAVDRRGTRWARAGMILTARNWEQASSQIGASGLYYPGHPQLLQAYLAVARKFGGEEAVKKELERFLVQYPDDVSVLLLSGKLAEAERALKHQTILYPGATLVQAEQARLLLAQGKAAEAKTAAEGAIRAEPNSAYAWLTLGDVETALGNKAAADAAYAKMAIFGAGDPAYTYLLP